MPQQSQTNQQPTLPAKFHFQPLTGSKFVEYGEWSQFLLQLESYLLSTALFVIPNNNKILQQAIAAITASGAPPSGVAGGDLSKNYPNPLVESITNASLTTVTSASSYIPKSSDFIIEADTTSNNVTINLNSFGRKQFLLIKKIAVAHSVFINPSTSIEGSFSLTLTNQWDYAFFVFDGTQWIYVSSNTTVLPANFNLAIAGRVMSRM